MQCSLYVGLLLNDCTYAAVLPRVGSDIAQNAKLVDVRVAFGIKLSMTCKK